MTITKNIRNHPYHFEQELQQSNQLITTTHQTNNNFTWLVFINAKWVPFASYNQHKLEQTLGLGGTFVDIDDVLFPAVKRVRVFPKANYLSYLGVKYRLSRVMQPHYERHGSASSAVDDTDPAIHRLLSPTSFLFADNNNNSSNSNSRPISSRVS